MDWSTTLSDNLIAQLREIEATTVPDWPRLPSPPSIVAGLAADEIVMLREQLLEMRAVISLLANQLGLVSSTTNTTLRAYDSWCSNNFDQQGYGQ